MDITKNRLKVVLFWPSIVAVDACFQVCTSLMATLLSFRALKDAGFRYVVMLYKKKKKAYTEKGMTARHSKQNAEHFPK